LAIARGTARPTCRGSPIAFARFARSRVLRVLRIARATASPLGERAPLTTRTRERANARTRERANAITSPSGDPAWRPRDDRSRGFRAGDRRSLFGAVAGRPRSPRGGPGRGQL